MGNVLGSICGRHSKEESDNNVVDIKTLETSGSDVESSDKDTSNINTSSDNINNNNTESTGADEEGSSNENEDSAGAVYSAENTERLASDCNDIICDTTENIISSGIANHNDDEFEIDHVETDNYVENIDTVEADAELASIVDTCDTPLDVCE